MKLTTAWLVAAAAGTLAAACGRSPQSQGEPAQVQPGRARIDVSKLGPQVGEHVPDFSLLDQSGRTRTLESIMGPRGAMLVFVRSADW